MSDTPASAQHGVWQEPDARAEQLRSDGAIIRGRLAANIDALHTLIEAQSGWEASQLAEFQAAHGADVPMADVPSDKLLHMMQTYALQVLAMDAAAGFRP